MLKPQGGAAAQDAAALCAVQQTGSAICARSRKVQVGSAGDGLA